MNSVPLITALYFLASLVAFLAFYTTSKNISGVNFRSGWFWFFFAWAMLWGMVQLNVARHGYILFAPSSKDIIENNYLVRWIAFISAIFQTACIPSKEKPRRWFSRK